MRKATTKPKPIGERIIARRKVLGESREDLALLWDVALSTVRNWEIGLSEPQGEHLATVTKWLENRGTK